MKTHNPTVATTTVVAGDLTATDLFDSFEQIISVSSYNYCFNVESLGSTKYIVFITKVLKSSWIWLRGAVSSW